MNAALAFELPERLEATEPPPERDQVRLLAASGDGLGHHRFTDLSDLLRPGDLLVVNTSATLPAALPAGGSLRLHLSTPLPGAFPDDGHERWVVELRDGTAPYRAGRAGAQLALPGGATAELLAPYLGGQRLWAARLTLPGPLLAYLDQHGEPIRYRHLPEPRPLADFQTIFALEPGSAEMPSAGRPFSRRVLEALSDRGVQVAPIVLHCGVSSLERGETPYPERFRVPRATAEAVYAAERVIAVGTTVVRALETTGGDAGEGWTRLVVTPETGVQVVDGIVTGWHEPDASHLLMLEAIAGRELVERSYAAALDHGYRWHEFGDSHLLIP
ncbi:MAG TPA: S-adenosylmethionine:tRNA ribosyltransferase-isomerase [Solirubrobacteraceae bacterium]|nr:S-adenosylmethionine:tRNA ribosyltransferase-isomerase [Solirubrobacteraceae bacterium]